MAGYLDLLPENSFEDAYRGILSYRLKMCFSYGGTRKNERCLQSQSTHIGYAADGGRSDLVVYMVKNGADLNIPNAGGETPLMRALQNWHMHTASVLHYMGASLDPVDNQRFTLLHHIAANASRPLSSTVTPKVVNFIKALLVGGIDAQIQSLQGETATEIARCNPDLPSDVLLQLENAILPWSPRTDSLYPPLVRNLGWLIMLVGHRLRYMRYEQEYNNKRHCRITPAPMMAKQIAILPTDLWLSIAEFSVSRSDFKSLKRLGF